MKAINILDEPDTKIFILYNRYYTMERGLMMVLHSVIIGVVLYLLMVFVFQQNPRIAENRSILIAAAILIYMILFGHGLPAKINKNL